MSRRTADDVVSSLAGGDFLTADTFRRTAEAVCGRIHETGISISIGTSSDRPMFLIEDIDIADDEDFEDAVSIDLDEIRRSSSWNAIAALMTANDQRFVVENGEGDCSVGVRVHPDLDRAEIRRLALKRRVSEQTRRLQNVEKLVLRIAEKLDA